jgi:hypothetical protein
LEYRFGPESFRLRDGKVVRFQQYTDTEQWSEAAGVPRKLSLV